MNTQVEDVHAVSSRADHLFEARQQHIELLPMKLELENAQANALPIVEQQHRKAFAPAVVSHVIGNDIAMRRLAAPTRSRSHN